MSASNPTQAFVGRRAELADLHGRLKHALDGHGGLVAVTGEPGAGKTSLIDRFLVEAVLQRPDLRIITTYCSEQYGADEPYQPFLEAFRDLVAGTQKPLPVRELAKQLAPAWLQAVPIAGDLLAAAAATVVEFRRKRGTQSAAGSAQTLRDVAAELAPQWLQAIPIAGQLMAAATSTAVDLGQLGNAKAGRAAVSEESLFHQYTELFLTAAEHSPILLVIDDVHWADRASVALLTHLTRQIAARRALVLITYRPADVEAQQHPILPALDALGKAALLTSIALGTFGEGDVAELLREQLDGDVDDELISWLGQRSNGNPLFLTELMRWLVEAGYARERRGEWQLARRPSDVEVPRSAESVIDKRLARLDPASYRLLEYASVEGDQFHLAALAQLLGADSVETEQALARLAEEHHLLRSLGPRDLPAAPNTTLYSFSHTIVQDVLHANLQPRRRILLHQRMASVLEDLYGEERQSIAPKLAIHYHEGRMRAAAYRFSLLAAEAAIRMFAIADALDLLQRALANVEDGEQRVDVLARMGEGYRRIGRFADALSTLEQARAAASAARALSIRRELVFVHRDHGSRSPQLLLDDLMALERDARLESKGPELCRVLWAYRLIAAGKAQIARAEEALAIAASTGDPNLLAKAHFEVGLALMLEDTPENAVPHLQSALQGYQQLDDLLQTAQCHNYLAVAHVFAGQPRIATEQFAQAAAIFERTHSPTNVAAVRNNIGALLLQTGEWNRAEHELKEALRLTNRMDAAARLLHPLENLARLYQAMGDWARARTEWQNLLQRARDLGYWSPEAIARCGLGTVALEEGNLAEARAMLRGAELLLPADQGWSESRVEWQLLAGRVVAAEGEPERADQLLQEAESALSPRDRFRWGMLRYHRAVALSSSNRDRARTLLLDCIDVFNRIDAQPMRAAAQKLLDHLRREL